MDLTVLGYTAVVLALSAGYDIRIEIYRSFLNDKYTARIGNECFLRTSQSSRLLREN